MQIVVDGRVATAVAAQSPFVAPLFDQLDDLVVRHTTGLRFHAGAVERDGRVIVILGQSGAGKSTLTATLVKRGFTYLTDEVAIVDPTDGHVTAYPRPFDLDQASQETLGLDDPAVTTGRVKSKIFVDQLGAVSKGGRVDLVIVLTGTRDDGGRVEARTFPRAEALMALLSLTFGATFDDPDALGNLAALCEDIPIIGIDRGPADRMALVVEGAFG